MRAGSHPAILAVMDDASPAHADGHRSTRQREPETAPRHGPPPAWHALGVERCLQACGSDPLRGLEAAEVRERQARHGPNALPEAPPRPPWRVFVRQLASPLIYILFVAALLAMALGHHGDAVVILAVVAINAAIGTFQEGRAERSMTALRRLAA
jgi:magnesium-transporting ATPase (P-type)